MPNDIFEGTVEKVGDSRPCVGTTVTVSGLFCRAPVRAKHMKESPTMSEVVARVQAQAICLAGKVSISLRDEEKGKILLNTSRIKSVKGRNPNPELSSTDIVSGRLLVSASVNLLC